MSDSLTQPDCLVLFEDFPVYINIRSSGLRQLKKETILKP